MKWLAILCVSAHLCLNAQPAFPTIVPVSVTRVYSVNGTLFTNTVSLNTNKPKPYIGQRVTWTHDPALRQFTTFRAYARTNLNSTNEALWGTTTNWQFDYVTSADRPTMYFPRIVTEDHDLPKLSDGRPK